MAESIDSEPGKSHPPGAPVPLVFIYGAASDGLCPFENALHGKSAGESLTLTVSTVEAHTYFAHLLMPLRQALGLQIMPANIKLHVKITTVDEAENREVVQFLAKAVAGAGCGGSCGCGC